MMSAVTSAMSIDDTPVKSNTRKYPPIPAIQNTYCSLDQKNILDPSSGGIGSMFHMRYVMLNIHNCVSMYSATGVQLVLSRSILAIAASIPVDSNPMSAIGPNTFTFSPYLNVPSLCTARCCMNIPVAANIMSFPFVNIMTMSAMIIPGTHIVCSGLYPLCALYHLCA